MELLVQATKRFPPHPTTPRAARRFLADVIRAEVAPEVWEAAVLLTSELVTNAVVHAGTDVHLRIEMDRRQVRIEVGDGSSHLPRGRVARAHARGGRGLQMVERLSSSWGVDIATVGKTVWCLLPTSVLTLAPSAVAVRRIY